MLFHSHNRKQHQSVCVFIVCHFFCRHCRDVRSDVCHGSTISSADFLRKLNHAHKSRPTLLIVWRPLKGDQCEEWRGDHELWVAHTVDYNRFLHNEHPTADKSNHEWSTTWHIMSLNELNGLKWWLMHYINSSNCLTTSQNFIKIRS